MTGPLTTTARHGSFRSIVLRAVAVALCLLMLPSCASQPEKKEDDHFLARLSKNAKRKQQALAEARKKKLEEFRKSGGRMDEDDRRDDDPEDDGVLDYFKDEDDRGHRARRGVAIKVTWEGLARERELYEASKQKRNTYRGPDADMKITLVSEGHPDAKTDRKAGNEELEARAHITVVPDSDLKGLVRQLEKEGYYRYARDTDDVSSNFDHSRARGRVTVERAGESVTLLNMRGQGLNPSTKQIPKLYSSAKRAILIMRNRRPTLNWTGVTREGVLPTEPSKGSSRSRRLRSGDDRRARDDNDKYEDDDDYDDRDRGR